MQMVSKCNLAMAYVLQILLKTNYKIMVNTQFQVKLQITVTSEAYNINFLYDLSIKTSAKN